MNIVVLFKTSIGIFETLNDALNNRNNNEIPKTIYALKSSFGIFELTNKLLINNDNLN